MTVPIAAIVLLKNEEELIEQFRAHGACSRDTAKALSALAVKEDRAFRSLRGYAVIREGAPGMFYCDEETVVARQRMRRRMVMVTLVVLAIMLLVGVSRNVSL
jgi:hypothetical protein